MLGYAYETPQISLMESVARFHPDDLPRVQAAIQAHLEQRTAFYEVEHRMRCQDGSYKWVLCRGRVTERAADGTPLRMVGTTTDISTAHALAEQLKAQNAKLRDNTAKLSALTRELAERTRELKAAHRLAKLGSWRWDLQNRSIHFSRDLWRLIGLPASEEPVTYEQIKLLHHPDDYHDALAAYYKAAETREPVTLECRIVQPGGLICHVFTHVEPILQPDGSVTQLRGTSQNITAYRNIEAALRDSEDHYRHMVELHPQIPWTAGPDGGLLEFGPRWYQLTGMTPEATLPFGWITALHPDDRDPLMTVWRECLASARPLDYEYRIQFHDGRTGWFRARAAARVNHRGEILRWYGTLEDVTDRHMAEAARRASEALAFRVLEATKDAVIVFDRNGHAKYANAQATVLFGSGAPLNNRWHRRHFCPAPTKAPLPRSRQSRCGSRRKFTFHVLLRIFGPLGRSEYLRGCRECFTVPARHFGQKTRRGAAELPGPPRFPDRHAQSGRIFRALSGDHRAASARTGTPPCSVWTSTISRALMTSHGHPVGDRLLQQIVARLSALLGPNDLLARAGGDEFLLAQTGIATEEEADGLAAQILRAMRSVFAINELVIASSMSVGVAMTTEDVTDVEAVYKRADIALYQSKTHAKGNFRFFHPEMQEKFDRAHRLRLDLTTALENRRTISRIPADHPHLGWRDHRRRGIVAMATPDTRLHLPRGIHPHRRG